MGDVGGLLPYSKNHTIFLANVGFKSLGEELPS